MVQKVRSATDARNWPATDKRQQIAVEHARNLYLIVQPSGSKSWAWRARRIGETTVTKVTLGSLETYSLKDARDWADKLTKARDAGDDDAAAQAKRDADAERLAAEEAKRDEKTLTWFWETHYLPRFVETLEDRRETERQWKKLIKPDLGHMRLDSITHDDLARMVEKVRETAPVTANRVTTMVKTMFKRALTVLRHETGLTTDPAQFLVKPTNEAKTRVQRVLDRRELGYVLRAVHDLGRAKSDYRAVYARALRLCLVTGCRIQEALGAPWSEFDLEAGVWTIDGSRSKNDHPHVLPLPPITVAWLKGLREKTNSEWVFSVSGDAAMKATSKPQAAILEITRKMAARDGREMTQWAAHALRRTFSTELSGLTADGLNALVPPAVVEALLNHQSGTKAGVAGVYNKYSYRAEKAVALRLWEQHLETVLAEERQRHDEHLKEAA